MKITEGRVVQMPDHSHLPPQRPNASMGRVIVRQVWVPFDKVMVGDRIRWGTEIVHVTEIVVKHECRVGLTLTGGIPIVRSGTDSSVLVEEWVSETTGVAL